MFKQLLNDTKKVAAVNEFAGKTGDKVHSLVDIFENEYFDHEFESFIEKHKMTMEEQVEFTKELMDRQDLAFETLKEQELRPEAQAIVMELGEIQKKMNALKVKLEEFKQDKKDISQPVVDALNELDLQNIRVGKILVSLYQGKTAASFKAVMDAIENQLTPAVSKLLRETYASLSKVRAPELRVKVESVDEGIGGFLGKIFRKLLGGVSNALNKIEGLLGGVSEEEIDPNDETRNRTVPIVFGLG